MTKTKKYEKEYKVQAVKLAKEIGKCRAAKELCVPEGTLYGWVKVAEEGSLDCALGLQTPNGAKNLAAEVQQLRKQVKAQEKEIRRLNELNEFLEEASAFLQRAVGSREK